MRKHLPKTDGLPFIKFKIVLTCVIDNTVL